MTDTARIHDTGRNAIAARPDPAAAGTFELAHRPVARIGFGAMQLPGAGVRGRAHEPEEALAVLRRVVELGINHIDTAQFYGDGVANGLIRAALHPYPDDLVLVSKVGARWVGDGGIVPAQRRAQLRAGVEANLASLGVDRVDVVNLRVMDTTADGTPLDDEDRADFEDQLAEMVALRDEGKIGGIGLSNVTVDQLRRALPAGIACVQNAYSVLDRSAEPILQVCAEHGVAWVPFFPLGSAFAGLPKVTEHRAVIEAATTLDATPAQVGLAWLLAHDRHTLLIPGTSNPDHVSDNVAAASLSLDADTMRVLDGLADVPA